MKATHFIYSAQDTDASDGDLLTNGHSCCDRSRLLQHLVGSFGATAALGEDCFGSGLDAEEVSTAPVLRPLHVHRHFIMALNEHGPAGEGQNFLIREDKRLSLGP